MPRAIRPVSRGDAGAVAVQLEALDRLFEAERRAMPLGQAQMSLDRSFRREPARLAVQDSDPVGVDVEDRVAPPQLRAVEHLVRETVRPRARERSGHELAVGRSHVEAAGLREQRLSAVALELAPEIPGTLQHRDVARVLVIRETDDPREPAERRERVTARKAIEAEDALPPLRE